MNTERSKAFNLLLCFLFGAVIGGMLGLFLPGPPANASGAGTAAATPPDTGALNQDAGVQAMQGIDDAKQRRFALLNNLTRLAMTNLPRALELLPADESHDAVLRDWITQRLTQTRPDLAVQAAAAMRDVDARAALMAPLVFAWHELNAPLAAGWLRNHLDEPLARQLVTLSMNHDPAFVGRVLYEANGGVTYQRHFRDLLQRWAQVDNADAFRFIERLPTESFLPAMMAGVGGSLLTLPAGPVKIWLARLPEETRSIVIEDMVAVLPSVTTLDNARQWMNEIAPLASRSDAVAQWFATLVQLDPEQAQQALETMDNNPARDACISGCVQALGVRDRASALDWTLEMADLPRRLALASEQWLAWLQEDRTSAVGWLKSEAANTVFDAEQRGAWTTLYQIKP